MEKRKRIETQLPEAMIQLIQSFLSEEEAARTTLISKSWYNAWLTHPVLVLRNLGRRSSATMRRYQDSNLKIESFRLKLQRCTSRGEPLAHRLVVDAMKLGATDLNLEFKPTTFVPTTFVLPAEVLGSETLLRLSVSGCVIDGNVVNCSMLKSLSLDNVALKSAAMLRIMTSCCNSIEELSLSNSCISNHRRLLSGMKVHQLLFLKRHRILLSGEDLPELHKLKRLYLETVAVDNSFFHDLESRLPCLEDMSLVRCYCTAIRVKSSSLQRISIVQRDASKLELEVPNLAVFSYSGGSVPWFISIKARDECESHISMEFDHFLTSSWYLCLHKLLTQLSPSRINLTINIGLRARSVNDTRVVGKPVAVENLRIETKYDAACFLQCLFRICRPKLVTHCLLDEICSSSLARE
ncbi:uncharacterized protein LOC130991624 isoform X3 [Salvia miltiorrhiza]|uniref:uncharacterized protein LOC130991624 isoform X3 n=1 Tax=Salvia miltiorrhiza TaxID=226208 RepID=UPI0025AC4DBA|nr:uncharacterized protein LOC130991624 isoform X3 [Salvia miltiorrhiza]